MTTLFQTFALSGQMSEPIHNLIRLGPETACQFLLPSAATVRYKTITGGTTYTDTVAALIPATVYPVVGAAKTTVDVTVSRYVIFILPAYGGAATLYIADEGTFNFYAQQGYIIPLYYCYLHGWQIYQNTTGVATPPPGGSMSGSGSYGSMNSGSWSGNGATSGNVDMLLPGYNGARVGGIYEFNLKVSSLPASQTALFEHQIGSPYFVRLSLKPSGALYLEWNINTSSVNNHGVWSGNLTSAAALPVGVWVSVCCFIAYNEPVLQMNMTLLRALNVLSHDSINGNNNDTNVLYAGPLLLGQAASTTGYLNFPNTSAWRMSKFLARPNETFGWNGLPISCPPTGATDGYAAYNAGETPGMVSSLLDSSGNALTLSAGADGLTVYADGPLPS